MNKKLIIKNIFNKIIKFIKDLLDPRSDSSSKRFIAINAFYVLVIISFILLLPYEIKSNNKEILDTIIKAFASIIVFAFAGSVIEKLNSKNNEK